MTKSLLSLFSPFRMKLILIILLAGMVYEDGTVKNLIYSAILTTILMLALKFFRITISISKTVFLIQKLQGKGSEVTGHRGIGLSYPIHREGPSVYVTLTLFTFGSDQNDHPIAEGKFGFPNKEKTPFDTKSDSPETSGKSISDQSL